MAPKRIPLAERFWPKVDKAAGSDGCWIWKSTIARNGYGRCWDGYGSQAPAHRLSYEMAYGAVPEGLWVLHRCDVKACVNPAHLYAGTVTDNVRDAVDRGRLRIGDNHPARLRPETRPRGDAHFLRQHPERVSGVLNPNARVGLEHVIAIRAEYEAGDVSQKSLGRKYGLSQSQISSIVRGDSWAMPDSSV